MDGHALSDATLQKDQRGFLIMIESVSEPIYTSRSQIAPNPSTSFTPPHRSLDPRCTVRRALYGNALAQFWTLSVAESHKPDARISSLPPIVFSPLDSEGVEGSRKRISIPQDFTFIMHSNQRVYNVIPSLLDKSRSGKLGSEVFCRGS